MDLDPRKAFPFLDRIPNALQRWWVYYNLPEPTVPVARRDLVMGPFAAACDIPDNATTIATLTTHAALVDPKFRQALNPSGVDAPQVTLFLTGIKVEVDPILSEQDDELRMVYRTLFLGHSRGELSARHPLHEHVGHMFVEGVSGTTTADTVRFSRRRATVLNFDEPLVVNLNTDTFGLYTETAVNTAGAIPAHVTLYGAGFLNAHGTLNLSELAPDIGTGMRRFADRAGRAAAGLHGGLSDLRRGRERPR